MLAVLPAGAEPTAPSDAEIAAAREAERLAEASVAEVEAMLDDLRAASEAAAAQAGLAAETYNQAIVDLQGAETEADAFVTEAELAQVSLDQARGVLARVAMVADDAGSTLAVFEPFLRADGLDEALARAELIHMAGTASGRAADAFAVAEQAARAASVRADQAVALREERAADAERAAVKAERAANSATQSELQAKEQHEILLATLAQKRGTTADLEGQAEQARIAAENERARAEAEAQQAAPAEETPQAEPAEEASVPPSAPAEATPSPEPTPDEEQATTTPDPSNEPTPTETPATDPEPEPGPAVTPEPPAAAPISEASAGEGAVAWARGQIGKPYQWGASGPDGFDCSGLTSQAWLNGGGKAIPRTAGGQYAAATKVPFDAMRPGDLIFWGSSATSIYHVAIYSGGGMMIEAPRAGETVTEIPIRWSGVFGYAGRF
jgi:cell wall-associated NlpC family hydrolase